MRAADDAGGRCEGVEARGRMRRGTRVGSGQHQSVQGANSAPWVPVEHGSTGAGLPNTGMPLSRQAALVVRPLNNARTKTISNTGKRGCIASSTLTSAPAALKHKAEAKTQLIPLFQKAVSRLPTELLEAEPLPVPRVAASPAAAAGGCPAVAGRADDCRSCCAVDPLIRGRRSSSLPPLSSSAILIRGCLPASKSQNCNAATDSLSAGEQRESAGLPECRCAMGERGNGWRRPRRRARAPRSIVVRLACLSTYRLCSP